MDGIHTPLSSASRAEYELQAFLDATADAVIVSNHVGAIEAFNKAAGQMFGYTASEILGQPVSILMPDPDRSAHAQYMRSYQTSGQAKIIGIGREVVAQRADGTRFPAHLAIGEIKAPGSRRFVAFIHDISIRNAALNSLRVERDRAQNYLDLAQVILLAIDRECRITLINKKGCELLGRSESELLGKDWFEVSSRDSDQNAARELVQSLLAEQSKPSTYRESLIRNAAGKTTRIAWRATVLRDTSGQPTGLLSSGEDITARRQAQDDLIRNTARLLAAETIADLGAYEIHEASRLVFWSPHLYALMDRDPSLPPLDMPDIIDTLIHPDDRAKVKEQWHTFLVSEDRFDTEHRIVKANGEIHTVHSLAKIQDGRTANSRVIIGTLHDITQRKKTEEEARRNSEQLAHVGRLSTMGEMAAGLAHEINQPLTAIAAYAQASLRLLSSDSPDALNDAREAMQQIANQALRAGGVIRTLRSLVQNKEIEMRPLDMRRLIIDLHTLAATDARASDVQIKLALDVTTPPILGDAIQIQQVLLNLIRNAIDSTVAAQQQAKGITVRCERFMSELEVSVSDHGVGVPSAAADKVFDAFFTTKEKGTGLGLSISQSIIKSHGGKLSYRDTPGGGATFYFSLPLLQGAPAS